MRSQVPDGTLNDCILKSHVESDLTLMQILLKATIETRVNKLRSLD